MIGHILQSFLAAIWVKGVERLQAGLLLELARLRTCLALHVFGFCLEYLLLIVELKWACVAHLVSTIIGLLGRGALRDGHQVPVFRRWVLQVQGWVDWHHLLLHLFLLYLREHRVSYEDRRLGLILHLDFVLGILRVILLVFMFT